MAEDSTHSPKFHILGEPSMNDLSPTTRTQTNYAISNQTSPMRLQPSKVSESPHVLSGETASSSLGTTANAPCNTLGVSSRFSPETQADTQQNPGLHPFAAASAPSELEIYLFIQLALLKKVPPLEECLLPMDFAKTLGFSQDHIQELFQTFEFLDEQSLQELLTQAKATDWDLNLAAVFLCDFIRLHGYGFKLEEKYHDTWFWICTDLLRQSGNRLFLLESLSTTVANGEWRGSKKFEDIRDDVLNYYLPKEILQTYLVVDLSNGPDARSYPIRITENPPDLDDDKCRTTELWLKQIRAGSFLMGSPGEELGRYASEVQHKVTISKDFFLGLFPVTQAQWHLVMGDNPSHFQTVGTCAPVENVSYDMICGEKSGWPKSTLVSPDSFLGKLRRKTQEDTWELPTEAQWEYACRAGTTSALYNNLELQTPRGVNPSLDTIAWYMWNSEGQTHRVGEKCPNAWGLYDMLGNVLEWCRDWHTLLLTENSFDPLGPTEGTSRILRGGNWHSDARNCRVAFRRSYVMPNSRGCDSGRGFRLAIRL